MCSSLDAIYLPTLAKLKKASELHKKKMVDDGKRKFLESITKKTKAFPFRLVELNLALLLELHYICSWATKKGRAHQFIMTEKVLYCGRTKGKGCRI